jgi:lactoylglutathione lyase
MRFDVASQVVDDLGPWSARCGKVCDRSHGIVCVMTTAHAMTLGNFSVSLAVKDIEASRAFYQKLGFEVFAGNQAQNWLILRNGNATVGLFQGAFERNTLTFNPGWDASGNTLAEFTDVRELQRRLKLAGIVPVAAADEATQGPAYMRVVDPDGNPILFDQHV